MTKKVVTIPHKSKLIDVAKILKENGVSGAPVVDDEGGLVGIVSEKDVFKALYPSHAEFYDSPGVWVDLDSLEQKTRDNIYTPVDSFMTKEVVTVNANASLMQVGSMMMVRGIHRVLVTGHEKTIQGIVTRRDIYQNILKNRLGI